MGKINFPTDLMLTGFLRWSKPTPDRGYRLEVKVNPPSSFTAQTFPNGIQWRACRSEKVERQISNPSELQNIHKKPEHDWITGWSADVLHWFIFFWGLNTERRHTVDAVWKRHLTSQCQNNTHTPTHQEQNKAILREDSWSSTPLAEHVYRQL